MQTEAVRPCQTAARGQVVAVELTGLISPPLPRTTGRVDGRRRQSRKHGRLRLPPVLSALTDIPPLQQPRDAGFDSGQDFGHIERRQPRRLVKDQLAFAGTGEHAQRMEVQIEIQGTAKPLDDHHGPAAAISHAAPHRSLLQRPHDDTPEDPGDRTTEVVIPRQSIPQTERHGRHPLPNRDIGEDPIDQMAARSATRRPPQLEQKPRPLHEKATSRSSPQPVHRNLANPPASQPQRPSTLLRPP